MELSDSDTALQEVRRLRGMARADRRASSIPLIILGTFCLASAPFANDLSLWRVVYWLVAGPTGFLLMAAWYSRRRARSGVAAGHAPYGRTGVMLLAGFVLVLPLSAAPLPTIGVALLAIAIRQRNLYLGVFAVVFALVGGLEEFAVFDNLLYRAADGMGWFTRNDGYFSGAPAIVTAVVGLMLLSGGLVALRRERSAGHG